MSKTKNRLTVWSFFAAFAFLCLLFQPTVFSIISAFFIPMFNGMDIKNLLTTDFLLSVVSNCLEDYFGFWEIHNILYILSCHALLIASLIIIIGIFTKIHRIAIAIASVFLLSHHLLCFADLIFANFKYYFTNIEGILDAMYDLLPLILNIAAYSLLFIFAVWLTVLYFCKKATPTYLKVLLFIPLIIFSFSLISVICFSVLNIIETFNYGYYGDAWLAYIFSSNIINFCFYFLEFFGLLAITFRLADFKSKKAKMKEMAKEQKI